MHRKALHCGYTTGTCAAAAARGALLYLQSKNTTSLSIILPCGEHAVLKPVQSGFTETGAFCEIKKEGGDDPDVTRGIIIRADVRLLKRKGISLRGGRGVGRVMLPGLPVKPGMPAINPVPRRMIHDALRELVPADSGVEVTISVPDGEKIAKKTLNPRLGIVGGISILGTTGLVIPYSREAFCDSIRWALNVAAATGARAVVLSTGRSSEKAARAYFPELPDTSFILMGDHVGFAVQEAVRRGIEKVIVACYPAKLLKIATGYPCTHVHTSAIDVNLLAMIAKQLGLAGHVVGSIKKSKSVRHAIESLSQKSVLRVCSKLAALASEHLQYLSGESLRVGVLVIGYQDTVLLNAGSMP